MKKILLILGILGFIQIYCFAGDPDDPPYVLHNGNQSISPGATGVENKCLIPLSVVDVTVHVNITDCPDYECEAKNNCLFDIYLYCNGSFIGEIEFDPKTCSYEKEVRASEGYYIFALFVPDPPGCSYPYNNIQKKSNNVVPPGGGDVTIDIKFCE